MKKLFALLLCVLALFPLSACSNAENRLTEEGRSSLEIYSNFTTQMRSGELRKRHIGVDSWYNAVTSESVVIKFSTAADGTRQLLYRERTPFVFWYYPPYDYYDGTQYYYKYKTDWFIDRSGKYNRLDDQDFLGIQQSFLNGNDVVSDVVYQAVSGYELETTLQSKDRTRYYTLSGQTDLNFQFSRIDVKAYAYDFTEQAYRLTDIYYYRYKNVNGDVAVVPPDDLNPAAVVNRLSVNG